MIVIQKECNRCFHKWFPRSENEPVECPKCHSPLWNKERVKGVKKE